MVDLFKGGAGGGSGGRIILQADLQLYVATTGSNITGDGSIGNPWATPSHAATYVCGSIDGNQHAATINVADGTYDDHIFVTEAFNLTNFTLNGNISTPANCVIKPLLASGGHFVISVLGEKTHNLTFNGFTLDATAAGFAGWQIINSVDSNFGVFNCALKQANNDGWYVGILSRTYLSISNITIDMPGSQNTCFQLLDHSTFNPFGTLTLTGTPTFSTAFVSADRDSILWWQPTISGTATGHTVTLTDFSSFIDGGASGPPPGTTGPVVDESSIYNGAFGWNTFAGIPTTTQIPTPGTGGVWKDTSGGGVYLAYNDAGTIKKVALV